MGFHKERSFFGTDFSPYDEIGFHKERSFLGQTFPFTTRWVSIREEVSLGHFPPYDEMGFHKERRFFWTDFPLYDKMGFHKEKSSFGTLSSLQRDGFPQGKNFLALTSDSVVPGQGLLLVLQAKCIRKLFTRKHMEQI